MPKQAKHSPIDFALIEKGGTLFLKDKFTLPAKNVHFFNVRGYAMALDPESTCWLLCYTSNKLLTLYQERVQSE